MTENVVNSDKIKNILNKTLDAIKDGRKEIFNISEATRSECEDLKEDIISLKIKLNIIMKELKNLEIKKDNIKNRLLSVVSHYNQYDDMAVINAYDDVHNIQFDILKKKSEEIKLNKEKKELENKLNRSEEIMKNAEKLVTQVGVSVNYLGGDLNNIVKTVENANIYKLLGMKIIQSQENERIRVARDIHDGPAQSMSNLVLKAELISMLFDRDLDRAREELQDFKYLVRKNLKDVRKIIYDLSPMSLDDLGLVPTLQKYCYDFDKESNINVNLQISNLNMKIKYIIELAIFRIIQEALNNIKKHSKADNVIIKIKKIEDNIEIYIKDDGIGFDMDNLKSNLSKDSGFGVFGMIERANHLNGKMNVESSIGVGTTLTITVPFNTHESHVLYD